MNPQLIFILGAIHMVTPMQNMDACNAALKGLDTAARFRSYCLDQRTGETIYARKRVKEAEPVRKQVEEPEAIRSNNDDDFKRNI